MDIKKELSEIFKKAGVEVVVTKEELDGIRYISAKEIATRKRIKELEELCMELEMQNMRWWAEIGEKYGLDRGVNYQLNSVTGRIRERGKEE